MNQGIENPGQFAAACAQPAPIFTAEATSGGAAANTAYTATWSNTGPLAFLAVIGVKYNGQ
jgi:hypothetical protein